MKALRSSGSRSNHSMFAMALVFTLCLPSLSHSKSQPYDLGHMGGSSMGGQCPFEGAFFSKERLADQAALPQAVGRVVKFAFRAKLGWYAIAYYPAKEPKVHLKEYGRFTLVSADKDRGEFVICLYDPDYKGEFIERVPNPVDPNDLSKKKKIATIELKVQGDEIAATVKDADSNQISFASGETFVTAPGIADGKTKTSSKHD